MVDVFPIPAFQDNYIWCLKECAGQDCLVVDPGDAEAVLKQLTEQQLHLKGILVTHHHWDHTNGIEKLLQQFDVPVYGPDNSAIEQVSHPLKDGDEISLLGTSFRIIATPGHTLDHICYIANPDTDSPLLFSGDTLFSAGCGRLFEGKPEQMFESLKKLKALPGQTQIYCTHEYTQANIRFALAVEPENQSLRDYSDLTESLRAEGKPSLPVLMSNELQINPFLRTDAPAVIKAVISRQGEAEYTESEILRVIRQWKDNFQ